VTLSASLRLDSLALASAPLPPAWQARHGEGSAAAPLELPSGSARGARGARNGLVSVPFEWPAALFLSWSSGSPRGSWRRSLGSSCPAKSAEPSATVGGETARSPRSMARSSASLYGTPPLPYKKGVPRHGNPLWEARESQPPLRLPAGELEASDRGSQHIKPRVFLPLGSSRGAALPPAGELEGSGRAPLDVKRLTGRREWSRASASESRRSEALRVT
jgi:hypothetical protein